MDNRNYESQKGHSLINILNDLEFFERFDDSEKREFDTSENYIIKVDPGETIVSQGSIDYSFFFLLEGEAIVTKNEFPRLIVATLKPGAIFGEISILSRCPRQENIIAKEEVQALRLNGELFEKLSPGAQAKLNQEFIKVLLKRLERNNEYLISLKGELESISQIGTQFKSDLQGINKKCTHLDGLFDNINETIVKLIR